MKKEFKDMGFDLVAGNSVECRVHRVNNRGSGGRPITPAELKKKFVECTDGYLDASKAGQAFDLLAGLEAVKDVREITRALGA